jgi:hypothetical protein
MKRIHGIHIPTLVVLVVLLLAGCGVKDIKVGDPKEDVLDKYGVPENRAINRNGQLSIVSLDSDPMRSCRGTQPPDEIWIWGYKEFILRIENGRVVNITKAGDVVNRNSSVRETANTTPTSPASTPASPTATPTSKLTEVGDVSAGAKLVLGQAQVTIVKLAESTTTPLLKKPAQSGMKFILVEFNINKLKAGENLSSDRFVLEGSSGKQYGPPRIYVSANGIEGETGTTVTADKAASQMQLFFEVTHAEDVSKLKFGYK